MVISKLFYCTCAKDEYVFKQGDNPSCFFIVYEGLVAVEIGGVEKKRIKPSEGFGELALLYSAPRSASIKAVQDTGFYAIESKTFKKVVEEVTTKQFRENREFLNGVDFFNSMTDTQKDAIAGVIMTQKFRKGDQIITEGDQASSYYIIKEVAFE
jgi:cGMP-dependent protein kinase